MKRFIVGVVVLLLGSNVFAEMNLRKAEKLLNESLVDVVLDLQYDEKGDVASAMGLFCSACARIHYSNLGDLLAEGSNIELTGFPVAADKVLVPDILLDEEALKGISVKWVNALIPAEIITVDPTEGMILLQLAKPLDNCKVIKFSDPEKSGKLYIYSRISEQGEWISRLLPFARQRSAQLWNGSRLSSAMPGNGLILNEAGNAVAVLGNNNELLEHDFWETPYTKWKGMSYQQYKGLKKRLQEHLQKNIFAATLYFKELKLSNRERLGNSSVVREANTYIFKMPDGRIFMPILLAPAQYGRLEKIQVHFPQGDVNASVVRVMKNFGGSIIKLDKDVPFEPLAAAVKPMRSELGMQVWAADVEIYGNKQETLIASSALVEMQKGFMHKQYGGIIKGVQQMNMIFTLDGKWLGVRLGARAFNYPDAVLFLSAYDLVKTLNDPQQTLAFSDFSSPEDAVGDLGIEYQGMNQELARSLQVEKLTRFGREGLLISYVYKNSCADKMGLKAGDILLKLIVPECGKPISLSADKFASHQAQQFPWQQLDKIPEMYYSEIPEPWNGIRYQLNQQLTTIGICNKVELIAI
ncbi:MAG: hypothetical protein J6S19_02580 [Lentisphaeria bacterium]|nr:hypothetical protein [Lentisphaeria bacterium]